MPRKYGDARHHLSYIRQGLAEQLPPARTARIKLESATLGAGAMGLFRRKAQAETWDFSSVQAAIFMADAKLRYQAGVYGHSGLSDTGGPWIRPETAASTSAGTRSGAALLMAHSEGCLEGIRRLALAPGASPRLMRHPDMQRQRESYFWWMNLRSRLHSARRARSFSRPMERFRTSAAAQAPRSAPRWHRRGRRLGARSAGGAWTDLRGESDQMASAGRHAGRVDLRVSPLPSPQEGAWNKAAAPVPICRASLSGAGKRPQLRSQSPGHRLSG